MKPKDKFRKVRWRMLFRRFEYLKNQKQGFSMCNQRTGEVYLDFTLKCLLDGQNSRSVR